MNNVCRFLSNNFTVSWDPEKLTKDFPIIFTNSRVFRHQDGKAYWQQFDSNILFARNFYLNFKKECEEVASKLNDLKRELIDDSELVKTFLDTTIVPNRVNLIKTVQGKDIGLHKDITRSLCINIGLKNSNYWCSYISTTNTIEEFDQNNTIEYTINDGDAYILHINNPHGAVCLNNTGTRYVITYTL